MIQVINILQSTLVPLLILGLNPSEPDSDCAQESHIVAQSTQDNHAAKPDQLNQEIVRRVERVLADQNEAWNRGDIDRFMDGYWNSEKLSFTSGDATIRGWQSTIDRYKTRYATREKMGQLKFDDLEITPLGSDSAFVLGTWRLKRKDDQPHGRFTLVFRKIDGQWKIVHDHTSSAEPKESETGDDSAEHSDDPDGADQDGGGQSNV